MKKYFIDLLRYNDWANSRILITLEESEVNDSDILQLYSHTLSAQIIWLNRIKDIPVSPFPVWETYNLRELRSMTEESSRNWMSFVQAHPNQTFEEMINYQSTEGKKYENTLRQIIAHVVNHSTYHRGQLAIRLKEKGIQPPSTDYIVFARE